MKNKILTLFFTIICIISCFFCEKQYLFAKEITPTIISITDNSKVDKEEQLQYLGEYRITHYCNCSSCCGQWAGGPTASGVMPEAGITIATGNEFDFGTELIINGQTYTVQDRGVGNGCIDIYCSSHSEAIANGLYYTSVYIKK